MCANNDCQRKLGTGRKERKGTKEIAASATVFFVFFRFLRPISFVSALWPRSHVWHDTSGEILDRGFPECSCLCPSVSSRVGSEIFESMEIGLPIKTLERMTRSVVSQVFQCECPWRAPR